MGDGHFLSINWCDVYTDVFAKSHHAVHLKSVHLLTVNMNKYKRKNFMSYCDDPYLLMRQWVLQK